MIPDDDVPFNLDKLFFKLLNEEKATLTAHMNAGRCKDYPEYRDIAGRLIGLETAERVFKEIVSAWENR